MGMPPNGDRIAAHTTCRSYGAGVGFLFTRVQLGGSDSDEDFLAVEPEADEPHDEELGGAFDDGGG